MLSGALMTTEKKTFDEFRENFKIMVLSDQTVLGLFQVAALQDTEDYCPTQWGNLYMWLDVISDEWLGEKWDSYEEHAKECKSSNLSPTERMESVREYLIAYLFVIIDKEAADKVEIE